MVDSAVGLVTSSWAGKEVVTTEAEQVGFALFGPYQTLEAGDYSVRFDIEIPVKSRGHCPDDTICAYIEVVAGEGIQMLARRPLFAKNLKKNGACHSLDFRVGNTVKLEFRAYTTGAAPLALAGDRPVIVSPARGRFTPILANDDEPHDGFFEEHFHHFRDLYEKGAEIRPTADGTIVNLFGINLRVSNYNDFQMITEILIANGYKFAPTKDVCVLDIGMNAGFASLYFAKMDRVKFVHAFEPFAMPHARALDQFNLNPSLAPKIMAHPYGLGAKDEEVTVLYDSDHTIDVSIKGGIKGNPTTIKVRNAATVMQELLNEPETQALDLVVKLDCEGSEFPIIDALEEAGLLSKPLIYMMEWHKAWSPSKTQDYIIDKLNKAGFEVFDHTNPFDPYAGLLYAVRSN